MSLLAILVLYPVGGIHELLDIGNPCSFQEPFFVDHFISDGNIPGDVSEKI